MSDTVAEAPAFDVESLSHEDFSRWRANPDKFEPTPEPAAEPEPATPEPAEPADSADPESAPEKSDEKQKPDRMQRRFTKLTAERDQLRAQLAALEQSGAPAKAPQAEQPAKDAPATDRPQLKDFEDYDKYQEAVMDWKLERREAERTAAETERVAKATAKAQTERLRTAVEQARERYEDFDDVVTDDLQLSPAMQAAIRESDTPADVAYYLGSHPEEAARIYDLTPVAAMLAMGKIHAALAKAEPAADKRQVSAAPVPLKPVGGNSAVAAKRVQDMSLDEYRAARESGRIR